MTRRAAERVIISGLLAAYVALWGGSALVLHQTSDLDVFFWPSAETAASGHPLLIYSASAAAQGPNANGPLSLLPLVPIVAVANRLGWADDLVLRSGIILAAFAVFALLLATTAVRIIRRARGTLEWRLGAICVFLFAPTLWISVGDYGHIEQPLELWLVVLAGGYLITHRPVMAGVALGLAVLTRSTALLYIIPFALLPLASRRINPSGVLLPVTLVVAAAGFAPFLIADHANVARSLITYRGGVPIGGGSFWVAAVGTSWAQLAQHTSTYLVLTTAVVLSATILWRRRGTAITTSGFFGVLAVVAACFPMLSDATYPYYLLEPYVFAAIWWLGRPGSALNWRLAVLLLLTLDAFLAKQGAALSFSGSGLVEGVVSSSLLALVVGLLMADLWGQFSTVDNSANYAVE